MSEFVPAKKRSDKIRERRDTVASLIRDKTETEIAAKLHVSRETVVRDVSYLKKSAHGWIDDLAKGGFVFEYKFALGKLNSYRIQLEGLYNNTVDVWQKISVMKELRENVKSYLELLGETPTIHAYRKAVKKVDVQTA